MADDTPHTKQPGGIRPISIKPVAIKPVAPAAPAAAAPAAAPAAPVAGAAPQPTIRLKPIVPRPFTPGAKPAAPAAPAAAAPAPAPAPAAPAPAAAPAAAAPAPAPAAPASADPSTAPTIRLKPVAPSIRPASVTANLKKPEPAAPAEEAPAAPAAARPLAPAPASAEMKSEQLQAAKSKTSRISLDAALTAGDPAPGGPRTIRIKRPATEAPVGKLTSHIPAQTPDAASGEDSSTPLAQRRTIRVKRPGAGPASGPAAEDDGQPKEETVTPPEFATDVPPSAFSFSAAPVEKTNPVFPIIGLLAIAALGVAIFYLMIGDASIFNAALWPTPR